jgi:hypothetical protein
MATRPPHGPGVAARPPPDNFGSKKSRSFPSRDYPPRSAPSRRRLLLRVPTPWSCRSGRGAANLGVRRGHVGQWLGGGFLVFVFFFLSKDRKSEGRRMIRCCANTEFFCVFFVPCWSVNFLLVGRNVLVSAGTELKLFSRTIMSINHNLTFLFGLITFFFPWTTRHC